MSTIVRWIIAVTVAGLGPVAAAGAGGPNPPAADLVGPVSWEDYFPFRLGDSWTYDWKADGPLATGGAAVRTRAFDGTSFLSDSVGYKLVSDDGTYHLYTFENGVLAVHSSLEAGRYFDYDPPVVIAAPDLRIGEARVVEHPGAGRRWRTTLLGLERVTVPLGTFERALAVKVEMEGPEFTSTATHYFAPHVGLVAYRYSLTDAVAQRRLLDVDARLRLARLGGTNVATLEDAARVAASGRAPVTEDRGLRERLKAAIEKRYTWDGSFPGLQGEAELTEAGRSPIRGSFVIGPDLSVRIEAADAAARAALRNEISSFVTQRKAADFDLTFAETTFVRRATRPDGAIVAVAAGDPLATTYTIRGDEIVEMGRSMGRVSYLARERSTLRTDDGRTITVEYDVTYTANESQETISTEHTRDAYTRLGGYWVPQGRRVERQAPGKAPSTRALALSNLRTP